MVSKGGKLVLRLMLGGLLLWGLVSRSDYLRANVTERDSIAYWAAGNLLLQHQNPYDTGAVLRMEQERGYKESKPLVLRTPPWSLFLTLPLGVVSAFWGWILWVASSLCLLLVAMRLCWRLYGDSGISRSAFWTVGYCFAPVSACLVAGQMGVVLLIGVVLFLWLESKHPFLAGAALILPFAKPHLLSLFWIGLCLWIAYRKRYAVAAGFALALGGAITVAVMFDPAVFRHYREMLNQASIGTEFIPALSGVLRLLFFRPFFWMQFVPSAAGMGSLATGLNSAFSAVGVKLGQYIT